MIFRVSGRFQEKMAEKLKRSLHQRGVSLVHLFRFPRITINHGIVLYGFTEIGVSRSNLKPTIRTFPNIRSNWFTKKNGGCSLLRRTFTGAAAC